MPAPRSVVTTALKVVLFALLVFNTAAYLLFGTASEALDSLAWLTLLALFTLETGDTERFRAGRANAVIRIVRIVAAVALVTALVGYWRQREWLDVANVSLWIGVVGLLEFGVRRPETVARHRRGFVFASVALFTVLLGLVLAWVLRREWFDAYDAALWLAAFAILETGLLERIGHARSAT
jgi:hypothetical protein